MDYTFCRARISAKNLYKVTTLLKSIMLKTSEKLGLRLHIMKYSSGEVNWQKFERPVIRGLSNLTFHSAVSIKSLIHCSLLPKCEIHTLGEKSFN